MTPMMASNGTWLCPTPLHRARLLDLEAKLARPRAIMYGSLAIVFLIAIPWVGWLPFVPLAGAVLGYSALRPWIADERAPRVRRRRHRGQRAGAHRRGIALTGGPQSPAIAVILLPLVTLPARFSTRGVYAGLALTVAVLLAATAGADPAGFADDPTFTLVGVAAAVGLTAFAQFLMNAEMQQRSESALDPLTGLLNRTSLPARFAEIAEQAALAGDPVCVVVCDLDGFKAVNDEHGHDRGDDVLKDAALLLRKQLRSFELIYRLGGEEFLLVLPGLTLAEGRDVAERARAAFEETRLGGLHVTASMGVAAADGDDVAYQPLFRAADAALYEAKRSGRNRVVVVGDEGEVRLRGHAGAPPRGLSPRERHRGSDDRQCTGREQRPAGADRGDQEPAADQRDQLRRVAPGAVGRPRPAPQLLGHAAVDERADDDVLRAVPDPAGEVGAERERKHQPQRGQRKARTLQRHRRQRRGGVPRGRHPGGDERRPDHHAQRPERHQHAVAGVAGVQDVLGEEHLGGGGRGHEQQRDEGGDHDGRQDAVAQEEGEAVAGALGRAVRSARLASRAQRLRRDGDRQEARRVDEQRDPRPTSGGEQPAEDGAEVKPR